MKWMEFPEQTHLLGKPDNMTDEECGALPVYCDGKVCISKWELSDEEKKHVAEKGYVWLRVLSGNSQPPVIIEAIETVFIHPEDIN